MLRRKKKQPAQQPTPDLRRETHQPSPMGEDESRTLADSGGLLKGFRFSDVFSARHHSEDFRETRGEFIRIRLRFIALFFAFAVPLWIPVDYFTISPAHFTDMAIARGALGVALLLLGLMTFSKLSYTGIGILLGLVMLFPGGFYIASMLILHSGVAETPSVGYAYMPLLSVGLLGLFPLTLLCGTIIIALMLIIALVPELWLGDLVSLETFNMLWLFTMFSGVSLWIQSGQLLMLLKLYRESTRDPLTHLINRRVLMKRLAAEQAYNASVGRPFSVLMFDLDRFKRINDTYGHFTGDQVLKTAARVLEQQLRRTDIIARFGGEEFVAILPGLRGEEAVSVAERIRQACQDTTVTAPTGDEIRLSTSVGVTEYESGEEAEAMLTRVDDSLYRAKELGRNRVVFSQTETLIPIDEAAASPSLSTAAP